MKLKDSYRAMQRGEMDRENFIGELMYFLSKTMGDAAIGQDLWHWLNAKDYPRYPSLKRLAREWQREMEDK